MTEDAADGWLQRADAAPSPAPAADPPALFEGPTTMADIYRHLSPVERAEYDEARQQLLHTLDHMPRNGQEAWVSELRADLDREDLAIRRFNREHPDPN